MGLLSMAAPVFAASTPALSASVNGNSLTITVSNADHSAPVFLYQRQSSATFSQPSGSLGNTDSNGNYTGTINITFDGSSLPVWVYVTVDGQQSQQLPLSPGSCTANCVSGSLNLSQTSVNINSGQSATVTAYPSSGTISISSNSNSSVANAFVNGNSIIITGSITGSTTVLVCASANQCASILVSVNNGNANSLNFSNQSPVLTVGQSSTITIYSPNNNTTNNTNSFNIASNSNSNIVTTSISGSTLFLYGNTPGSATLNICQSNTSYCGLVSVMVGSGSSGLGGMTLSSNTLSLTVGQSGSVTVSNALGNLSVPTNSNSAVASAGVSGQTVTVYGIAAGSSTLSICQSSYSGCVSLYVQVTGTNTATGNGGVSFSNSSPTVGIGQNQSIAIYSSNNSTAYSISSNSNPNVASLSLSGATVYLVGQNSGTSSIVICGTNNSSMCGTLYVTVNGANGGLSFNPASLTVTVNQNATVAISGGSGSYSLTANTNPSAAAVSLQARTLYVTGLNSGTTNLTVCQSNDSTMCGTLLVTVGATSGAQATAISFSNQSPALGLNQTQSIVINGATGANYYISSINNPGVLSVTINGSSLNLTGTSAGSASLTVCQTGTSVCANLTATVNSSTSSSLYFSQANPPAGTVGQAYNYQVTAVSGNGSYVYSLTSGTLLAGLNFSASGLISGTPTIAGSANVTVKATDSSNNSVTASLNIVINAAAGSNSGSNSGTTSGNSPSQYQSGQLINENGTIAMVYKNTKTPFASAAAFLGLGFKFSNVTAVSNSGLALSGKVVVTAKGAHPRGTWLLSGSTVYFLTPDGMIPVPDWSTFLNNGGQAAFLVKANSYDLALTKLSAMVQNDARLK